MLGIANVLLMLQKKGRQVKKISPIDKIVYILRWIHSFI